MRVEEEQIRPAERAQRAEVEVTEQAELREQIDSFAGAQAVPGVGVSQGLEGADRLGCRRKRRFLLKVLVAEPVQPPSRGLDVHAGSEAL